MTRSKRSSVSTAASTSRQTHVSGVKLVDSTSQASSVSGAPVVYTPSTTSEVFRTPTASIASTLPTTSTSLNAVFSRLDISDQRKALRGLQNSILCEAFTCSPREATSFILIDSSDELWAAFCHLNVENKRRCLESIRKAALRKAFGEENGDSGASVKAASYSASVATSEATNNTLSSAFKKLSVEDQEKALAAVKTDQTPKKGLRRGPDNHDKAEVVNETLLDAKPDLAEWQELCRACGINADEIPISITKCKEILRTKNVALSDLAEAISNGTVAQTFPSLKQLRKYVQNNNKVANKAATKENRFLKRMLRELFRYRAIRGPNTD